MSAYTHHEGISPIMTDRMKAQSLRMNADAELAPQESAEVQRSLEADEQHQRWVEFEQRLRQRGGSVMQEQTPAAPADLAARVRAALAEADASDAERFARDACGDGRCQGAVDRRQR